MSSLILAPADSTQPAQGQKEHFLTSPMYKLLRFGQASFLAGNCNSLAPQFECTPEASSNEMEHDELFTTAETTRRGRAVLPQATCLRLVLEWCAVWILVPEPQVDNVARTRDSIPRRYPFTFRIFTLQR